MYREPGHYGGWEYRCENWKDGCPATLGCHPNGAPLGTPTNGAGRNARIKAHAAFDVLWKHGLMSRGEAYAWLAKEMGKQEAHIGQMSEEECDLVIRFVDRYLINRVEESRRGSA